MTPDPVREAIERAARAALPFYPEQLAKLMEHLLPAIVALRAKDAERIAELEAKCDQASTMARNALEVLGAHPMTDDQRERIEAAVRGVAADLAIATMHSVDGTKPTWNHGFKEHTEWLRGYGQCAERDILAAVSPVLDSLLAAQAAEIANLRSIISGKTFPVDEAKGQRIAELEGLLREARHDMHYLIRCVTSESSTDMELTKHARMRFAGEIETIEKIDAALSGDPEPRSE